MCKNFFKGLLGGAAAQPPAPAQPVPVAPDAEANKAQVQNPDVVDALTSGREASGRVRLGSSERGRNARVSGLSI